MLTTQMQFKWGTSYANTLSCGYPMAIDAPKSYSKNLPGYEREQSAAGQWDAWVTASEYFLQVTFRHIPGTSTTGVTGWDGSTGFRAFLEWCREMNKVRVYKDKDSASYIESYVVGGLDEEPGLEDNGYRTLTLTFSNTSSAYDGY